MPIKRRKRRRPLVMGFRLPRLARHRYGRLLIFLAVLVLFVCLFSAGRYLRALTGQFAVAAARRSVVVSVNDVINARMEGGYDYSSFINLEKDSYGNITALTTNMRNVNSLTSDLIRKMVAASNTGDFDVNIPLGSLTGASLLLGRGPDVPIRIVLLSSSSARLKNEFSTAGINQTKHEIYLELSIDLDVLVPWNSIATKVDTQVLVAETVIVGKVPDTYLHWG